MNKELLHGFELYPVYIRNSGQSARGYPIVSKFLKYLLVLKLHFIIRIYKLQNKLLTWTTRVYRHVAWPVHFSVPGSGVSLQHFAGNRELVDFQRVWTLQPSHPASRLCILRQHLACVHHRTHHLSERWLAPPCSRNFHRWINLNYSNGPACLSFCL